MPELTLPGAWNECARAFLHSCFERSGSHKSRSTYFSVLRCFFADPLKSPACYTKSEVAAFLGSPSTSNRNPGAAVSVSTRNSRLTALSRFYRFAADYEVDGAPLFPGTPPTAGIHHLKPDIRYRAMNTAELLRFFAAIPTDTLKGIRDRAIYLCYFWSARRRSEIARLTYGDLEPATFSDGQGQLRAAHVYHYTGKGHARQVKTKELPAQAWAAVDAYLIASGRKETIAPSDPLFRSVYRKRKSGLTGTWLNKQFKEYVAKASLDTERLSLHSLRHTASRERYQAGEDVISLHTLLDHSSLDVTYRYLMLNAGEQDSGAALLERNPRLAGLDMTR